MTEKVTQEKGDEKICPQKERSSLEELVLKNRKRTYKMFSSDLDAPITEDTVLLKMKIKCKLADNYSKLGEIPGVLVDHVARQKIMKELG